MKLLPRSKPLRALVVSTTTLVLALLGAELYLRAFAPVRFRAPVEDLPDAEWRTFVHRRSEVPGLRYELAPNVSKDMPTMHVETNALGMRGHPPESPRGAELLRVAAVGDSVTFGFGVAAEDAWPARLETLLGEWAAASSRRCEVLNFGVGGYSTRDESIVVEAKALPLQPDLVVVAYFLNDPDYDPTHYQLLHRYFRGTIWWEHSHLARLVARWKFERERDAAGGLYRWYHRQDSDRWQSVLTGFDRIRDRTTEARVPVLLVVFPCYRDFTRWEDYPYVDLHERVLSAARERGFATLDLVPAFAASGKQPGELSVDPEHPNALGHTLAARAIAEFVEAHAAELLRSAR